MRIAIDALGLPQVGGARTSALGWITALSEYDPNHSYLVFLSHYEPELSHFNNVTQRIVKIKNRLIIRLWAQIFIPPQLKQDNIDLLHSVKNMGIITRICPTILTINDLTHIKFDHLYPKVDNWFWKYIQPYILNRTTRVIAISKATKDDLLHYYHLPENKIEVIYPSCHQQYFIKATEEAKTEILNKYQLKKDYLLYVGGLGVHKNVRTLIRAFATLVNELTNDLVVIGGAEHTTSDRQIYELVDKLGISDRVTFLEQLPLLDISILYQAAKLFVFVSLNEGFGIANLEAMASGTPIVSTQSGSIPEIVGSAAIYIDNPLDHETIAKTIQMIINDNKKMKDLRTAGLSESLNYNWKITAQKTWELYNEVKFEE